MVYSEEEFQSCLKFWNFENHFNKDTIPFKMFGMGQEEMSRLTWSKILTILQRYTYRVLQTIQMNLVLLWVWAEWAVLGRAKTALKFKFDI